MQLIKNKISIEDLKKMAAKNPEGFVKAVIDIKREIMAVDAPMHADLEEVLLENGSEQENLWGIRIYPDNPIENRIEFHSMINFKPLFNNRSRFIEDSKIRNKITTIVDKLIQ